MAPKDPGRGLRPARAEGVPSRAAVLLRGPLG